MMRKLPYLVVVTLFLALSGTAAATESESPGELLPAWIYPDAITTQTAGYSGVLAVGPRYQITEDYSLDLLYGFSPAEIAGTTLHSLAVHNRYDFFHTEALPSLGSWSGYLGLGFVYGMNRELFEWLPDHYPKGYYRPTAFHLLAGLGFAYSWDHQAVFIEFVINQIEAEAYYHQPSYFHRHNIGSTGLGYRWFLE